MRDYIVRAVMLGRRRWALRAMYRHGKARWQPRGRSIFSMMYER